MDMTEYQKIYEGKQVCCTCACYCQHYRRDGKGYAPVYCGHCTAVRVRTRKPDQSCEHWKSKKKVPDRNLPHDESGQ